ncbi:hypothetical protein [Polynucleobacter necessarius]|uniref:hypothetical protein n=1 Tax=Polynucleobacter necessarius TaxID=576610 RepID=UPI001E31FF62|nr:hypothetical protein [Polynucleobacter necessarius]
MMKFASITKLVAASLTAAIFLSGCQATDQDGKPLTPAEIIQKRDATLQRSKTSLAAFIKQKPSVQKEMDEAAGYAVFTTTNVNIVLLVVARGEGVLFDKRRKDPNFYAGA